MKDNGVLEVYYRGMKLMLSGKMLAFNMLCGGGQWRRDSLINTAGWYEPLV